MKGPIIVKGIAMALVLVIGGCTEKSESAGTDESELAIAEAATSDAAEAMFAPAPPPMPKVPIPAEFIGSWKLAEIVCDADSEEEPPKHLPQAILQLSEFGMWSFYIEGFTLEGQIEVHPMIAGPELRLKPGALDFHMEKGMLVNDSEGDAPYQCVRYFKRDQS